MTMLQLQIIDKKPENIQAASDHFGDDPLVSFKLMDVNHATGYDCLITPGNSFGFMDGGFDEVMVQMFGPDTEKRVRSIIESDCNGEMNVGDAAIVAPSMGYPLLCYAPTMRVPMQITRTDNVYLAMRAALLAIKRHNDLAMLADYETDHIRTILCPMLGTGAGKMPPREAAKQMRAAWDGFKPKHKIPQNWQEADAIQAKIGLGRGGDPEHW